MRSGRSGYHGIDIYAIPLVISSIDKANDSRPVDH
jgi:hypothetical protein